MFLSHFSKALTVLTVSAGVLSSISPVTQAQNSTISVNQRTASTTVNPMSHFTVTTTVSNANPKQGETIVYTITFTNNMPTGSTQPYNGASITFTTSNLTYISNGGGGTYRTGSGLNPNTVQWVKPNLGTSGTTSTMTVTAKVPFYARGSITTNTYIGSGSGGPAYGPSDIPSNNASTVITVNEESSIAQSQNSPQNTTDPKIKLITVTCDQQTCGTNTDWKKATISNNKTFRDYICSLHGSFAGQIVLGIDDYNDGLSLNVKKKINSASFREPLLTHQKTYYDFGVTESTRLRRDCLTQNIFAGNINRPVVLGNTTGISSPSNNIDVRAFYDEPINNAPAPGRFTAKNIPVYAYQLRYNIRFAESEKVAKSDLYRSMTGLEGVYNGVSMTQTYYTYQQNGKFKTWENPNKSNANRGWLVYGY